MAWSITLTSVRNPSHNCKSPHHHTESLVIIIIIISSSSSNNI